MIIDVKVPMLSESVSEGTLLEWKKKSLAKQLPVTKS